MKRPRRSNDMRNQFSVVFPILTILGIGIITAIATNYEENWIFDWNGIRKEIKDSIRVSERRGITSGVGGNGISTIDEVKRRNWIMKNASQSELLRLTEYPNGTVKAIAYEGLLRKADFPDRMEFVQDVLMIDDQNRPPQPLAFRAKFGFSELDNERILSEFRRRQKKVCDYSVQYKEQ